MRYTAGRDTTSHLVPERRTGLLFHGPGPSPLMEKPPPHTLRRYCTRKLSGSGTLVGFSVSLQFAMPEVAGLQVVGGLVEHVEWWSQVCPWQHSMVSAHMITSSAPAHHLFHPYTCGVARCLSGATAWPSARSVNTLHYCLAYREDRIPTHECGVYACSFRLAGRPEREECASANIQPASNLSVQLLQRSTSRALMHCRRKLFSMSWSLRISCTLRDLTDLP